MNKSKCGLLGAVCICMLIFNVSAQQVASAEAGKYQRKSVSYVNALWLMDGSVKGMPSEKVALVLDKVKGGIFMNRFDYNPIPEGFIGDFVNQINAISFPPAPPASEFGVGIGDAAPDPMMDSVCAVMERTVVPKILEVVDAQKEMRAASLVTEQQKNSFIADKAKTLGITMDDVNKVMNSAYLFIPLIRGYHASLKDSSYTVGFDAGIVWFRISTTGEKARAVPVVRKFSHSVGFSVLGKNYPTTDGLLDYQEFAFRSAIKNAVRNLVVATQEVPDFRLSGQVIEPGLLGTSFDLGRKEGVVVDDKYHIVEMTENADGTISSAKHGWVVVTAVGDTNNKKGYKSRARVISGDAATGVVLDEYPRLPIEVLFKGRMFTFNTDSSTEKNGVFDSLSLNGNWGGGIDVQYNLGRHMGIPQFYFDIGFGIGSFGSVSGFGKLPGGEKKKIESTMNMNFEGSLVKKIYLRRVAIVLQPTYSWQYVDLRSGLLKDTTNSWSSLQNGFTMNGGLEIALGPACNFGGMVGYQMIPAVDTWSIQRKVGSGKWENVDNGTDVKGTSLNATGIVGQVYFTWSVPALPFDPVDLIRGSAGL